MPPTRPGLLGASASPWRGQGALVQPPCLSCSAPVALCCDPRAPQLLGAFTIPWGSTGVSPDESQGHLRRWHS